MSLLEQLQVCIFAEIVFGVRCTLRSPNPKPSLLSVTLTPCEALLLGPKEG